MPLPDPSPDPDALKIRDQIAQFWEVALERLKIRAERIAQPGAIKIKMTPIRVVVDDDERGSD
jgi:hypothetical protein